MANKKVSAMDKLSDFLERKLMPIGAKVSGQKHLKAVRDGMISAMPLSIVGGMFLILSSPPVNPKTVQPTNFFNKFLLQWYYWARANGAAIELPCTMTLAIMSLFVAMGIGYNLAKEYGMDGLSSAVNAGVTFLIVAAPAKVAVMMNNIKDNMDLKAIKSAGEGVLPSSYLDAKGLFTAIIIGLVTVEMTRFLKEKDIVIKMPEGVPPAVSSSFSAIIPLFVNVTLFYLISLLFQSKFGMLIPQFIMKMLRPAISVIDTAPAIFIVSCLMQILWLMGLHGAEIVCSVVGPFEANNIMANATAKMAGQALPHIYTTPFRAYFMIMGGSGATLALIILMLRSKSAHLKTVARVSFLPSIFNINEPVIFGTPLVLNAVMAIPFVFIQGINGVISFELMKAGVIGKTFIQTPWTAPAPIGGFLATMDWKAAVLIILLILMDIVLYYPFFKVYEKQLLEEQMKNS